MVFKPFLTLTAYVPHVDCSSSDLDQPALVFFLYQAGDKVALHQVQGHDIIAPLPNITFGQNMTEATVPFTAKNPGSIIVLANTSSPEFDHTRYGDVQPLFSITPPVKMCHNSKYTFNLVLCKLFFERFKLLSVNKGGVSKGDIFHLYETALNIYLILREFY